MSGSDFFSARSVAASSMKSVPSSMASSQSWAKSGSESRHFLKFLTVPPAADAAKETEEPTANWSRKSFRRLCVRTKWDMGS